MLWRGAVGRIPERAAVADFGLTEGTIVGTSILRGDGFLSLLADNAKAKRTSLTDLKTNEGSWVQVMGGLNGGRVVAGAVTSGAADMLLYTRQGKAIRFNERRGQPAGIGHCDRRGCTQTRRRRSDRGGQPGGAGQGLVDRRRQRTGLDQARST